MSNINLFFSTPCDRKFKSADSAVMHYFHDHGHAFNNSFPLDLTKKSLKCSEWNCNYQTYAKHHYIAHLGIYHGKFKDSYYNISSQIQGLSSFQNVIFEKCKKVIQPIGSGQSLGNSTSTVQANQPPKLGIPAKPSDVFMFEISRFGSSFHCMNCKMLSLSHDHLKVHLNQHHSMPIGKFFFFKEIPFLSEFVVHFTFSVFQF